MKEEFEKYAKEELNQQEVHVDVEALWENVAPHVQKKKKRNFLFWFWTLGASLLIIGAGLWFALGQNTDEEKVLNSSTISIEKSSTEKSIETQEEITIDPFIESETSKREATEKINKESIREANVTYFTEVKETRNQNHLPKGKSEENQKIGKLSPISITTIVDEAAATGSEAERISIHLDQALNATSTFVENIEKERGNIKTVKTSPLKNTSLLLKISKLNLPTMAMENILLNESVLENVDEEEPIPYKSMFPRRSSKSKSKIKFGMGLYGGIGLAQTSLETNYGPETYQSLREESERALEHLQLGLSGMVKIKNSLSLRTGLEYNRLGSKLERQVSDNIIDSIPNGVVGMFVNELTNDTMFRYGLVVNTESTFIDKQTYNYFHQIDVPVLLGYQLNKNKWSIGLEAGAIFNLALRRKGEVFKYNGRSYYDIKKDRDKWYKARLGIIPLLQLNVAYQLNDHFQLHASPYYRFNSIYTTTESNPIKEKRAAFGLQMGGRYWF